MIDDSAKIRKFALNSMQCVTKQATLQASDEKGSYLKVNIPKQLSDVSRNLKSGLIFETENFEVLKHLCKINSAQQTVILRVKLKLIVFSTQLTEMSKANIGNVKEEASKDNNNQEEATCISNETTIAKKKNFNKCEGHLHSLYGLCFSVHATGACEIK